MTNDDNAENAEKFIAIFCYYSDQNFVIQNKGCKKVITAFITLNYESHNIYRKY